MQNKTSSTAQRIQAMLTLALYLFWCTVGISSHNHDAIGNDLSTSLKLATHSSQPAQSISDVRVASAPQGPDQCPGCAFDLASVSGAISAGIVVGQPFTISQHFAENTVSRAAAIVDTTSRGPPSVA